MQFNYRLMNTEEDVKIDVTFQNDVPKDILIMGENKDYDFDELTTEDQQCIIDMINCKHMGYEDEFLPEFEWD